MVAILASCGGGEKKTSVISSPIEAKILDKSLVHIEENNTSYLYLKSDHKFYAYGFTKNNGYFNYGDASNGSWSIENKNLKLDFNDDEVWTLSIDLDHMEAILTHNFADENIGRVNKISTTPNDLIKKVDNDFYTKNIKITENELTTDQGWIVINETDDHSLRVVYLNGQIKIIFRPLSSRHIHDLGFMDAHSWNISDDGKKIFHNRVTHELIRKNGDCYITRSTMYSDNNWVKQYKMCP